MKFILETIFYENSFKKIPIEDEFMFLGKENREYFFVVNYKPFDLQNFFEDEKTTRIILSQRKLSEANESIAKNTSLIIYVEVNDLESFLKKNRAVIYKIEEDEYYFRKYVIIYTKGSINQLRESDDFNKKMQEILSESGRIDRFEDIYYRDEEFHVVMQLYTKIPYLFYDAGNREFLSISKQIEDRLLQKKLSGEYRRILEWLKLTEEYSQGDYFEMLEESFFNEEDNSEYLIDFLESWDHLK